MNNISLRLFRCLLAVLVCATTARADTLRPLPTHGVVVDIETRKPVQGALVLAFIPYLAGTDDGTRTQGAAGVSETFTDANGEFRFPQADVSLPNGARLKASIVLAVIKEGRAFTAESVHPFEDVEIREGARWIPIKLRPIVPKEVNGRTHIDSSAKTTLDSLLAVCDWAAAPKFMVMLDREAHRREADYPGALVGLPTLDGLRRSGQDCGVVDAFLREAHP